MKKLMLGLMMAFAVTAEAEVKTNVQIGDLKYELDTEAKTATITGYTGSPKSVDVAEVEYLEQKYIVTSVGEGAFNNCSSLTSVSLPNATTIGEQAFVLCENLTSVSLPNATTIGDWAFKYCGSLTSVLLPKVTTIGVGVFSNCENLKDVSLPSATTIGVYAFMNCLSLTSVYLPSVTTIEGGAFQGCSSLTLVSLPNATTIGGWAFVECDKLETVILSFGLLANPDREDWGLREEAKLVAPFTKDEIEGVTHKVAPFAGEKLMSEENYEKGCAYYGLTPKTEPQVVKEDEIAVKKESIAAPSAGTVKVEDNKVQLGVTVLKTSDLTAETKTWDKVKVTKDDIDVDEDGNIIVNVPVDSASGFMILQSKDAKVEPSDDLR